MQSLADGLPPEIAKQVHPNWRKNEADYWAARETLLADYRNRWIAFANGKVIASEAKPVDVFQKAQQSGEHPYVTCVGREHEPCKMRRVSFTYDDKYAGEALPLVTVEFRKKADGSGTLLDRVIPDTGADASALPWSDCRRLQFDPSDGVPGLIGGIGQSSAATLAFSVWVQLDGRQYPCRLQADFSGNERILGRDVINRVDMLFRGPSGEIVVNP
jgi:hypothetical protein